MLLQLLRGQLQLPEDLLTHMHRRMRERTLEVSACDMRANFSRPRSSTERLQWPQRTVLYWRPIATRDSHVLEQCGQSHLKSSSASWSTSWTWVDSGKYHLRLRAGPGAPLRRVSHRESP